MFALSDSIILVRTHSETKTVIEMYISPVEKIHIICFYYNSTNTEELPCSWQCGSKGTVGNRI